MVSFQRSSLHKNKGCFSIQFPQPELPHLTWWNSRVPSNSPAMFFCNPSRLALQYQHPEQLNTVNKLFLPHCLPLFHSIYKYIEMQIPSTNPIQDSITEKENLFLHINFSHISPFSCHPSIHPTAIQLLFKLLGMDLLNYFLETQVTSLGSSLSTCFLILSKNTHACMTLFFFIKVTPIHIHLYIVSNKFKLFYLLLITSNWDMFYVLMLKKRLKTHFYYHILNHTFFFHTTLSIAVNQYYLEIPRKSSSQGFWMYFIDNG